MHYSGLRYRCNHFNSGFWIPKEKANHIGWLFPPHAANFNIEDIDMDETAKQLFDAIQPHIQALGSDIVELPNDRSVIYRVFDFFVEIIPRKHRLTSLMNLDFSDCEDDSGKARDATEFAFIIGAMEAGGVIYPLESVDEIPDAINVVRQAYERATE